MKYYTDLSEPFNFGLITQWSQDSDAPQLKAIIDTYTSAVPEGKSLNWVVSSLPKPSSTLD